MTGEDRENNFTFNGNAARLQSYVKLSHPGREITENITEMIYYFPFNMTVTRIFVDSCTN